MKSEDYWKRVTVTAGCWLWKGGINKMGYGFYGREKAHRMAWEFAFGKIPEGKCVCHKCDVRHCVKPSHLFHRARPTMEMFGAGEAIGFYE